MSKDIQNKTNMKRANSESFNRGLLINAKTGEKCEIENDKEFLIGRYLNGSLILEAAYISRCHCTIKYQDNQFIIFDNNSTSGTFLNFEKLGKGLINFKVLYDGDLITFGDPKKMEFIYKFSLSSNMDKRPRLDNDQIKDEDDDLQYKQVVANSQKSLNFIHSEVLNLNAAKEALSNETKNQFAEFQKKLKIVEDIFKKMNAEIIKKNDVIGELTKDRECLETRALLQDEFKNQVSKILENDLLCSICSEVIVKIHTANCTHSFCESCIKQWLNKSKICPICRTRVTNSFNSLVMDNFITNLCSLIGGTIKEQHDNLIRERYESSQPKKRGRGRQKKNATMSTTQLPVVREPNANMDRTHYVNRTPRSFLTYPVISNSSFEIVDLTNTPR